MSRRISHLRIWLKGIVAAGISGAAGGVMTGLAAVGIDPAHFNLQAGWERQSGLGWLRR